MPECKHSYLLFGVVNSSKVTYKPPEQDIVRSALRGTEPARKRVKKLTTTEGVGNKAGKSDLPPSSTFPAPVVTPGDEIYHDPDYPPQSVQECQDVRNNVTKERRTLYVLAPPALPAGLGHLDDWRKPSNDGKDCKGTAQRPEADAVVDYLSAFYHGVPVKLLRLRDYRFTSWDDEFSPELNKPSSKKSTGPSYIGLATDKNIVRICCRPSPGGKYGIYATQLNLTDLLDTAIEVLPKDAYALLMLVDQDLYESEDDEFCCGRAYGGSRVAVVSTARYRPELDKVQQVDRIHSWPASHCYEWIARRNRLNPNLKNMVSTQELAELEGSAVAAAVLASNAVPPATTAAQLSALWLGRVCKTASHELGHCFGIDHCMYYACIMQGTANLAEDARQPPYLCPVDLKKVLLATGTSEKDRYEALLEFCEKWKEDRMFATFGAWLDVRLQQLS